QIAELTEGHPDREAAATTVEPPAAEEAPPAAAPAGEADADGAGTAAGAEDAAPAEADPVDEDATTVAPKVADGTVAYHVDPAAPWLPTVGGTPTATSLQAGLAARVHLRFDETKADLDTQQEWEAIVFPLDGPADPEAAVAVDYDDRDLRTEAPTGATYTLPDAKIHTKTYFRDFETALKNHLHRSQQVELSVNPELKLYSRIGETPEEFAARCAGEADARADEERAKLTEKLRKRADRVEAAIAKAQDRVEELEVDVSTRKTDRVLSGLGSLAGAVLGGRKSASSIARGMKGVLSKSGQVSRTQQRVETARNRVEDKVDELEELEAELADQLLDIDERWDAAAAAIETMEVGLEKTDITVDQVALIWVPTA
ncbi:MAG: hypothetical protein AAGK32_06520, partial [Actinomycetota bacterium]